MATVGEVRVPVRITMDVSDDTIRAVCVLLDVWQDAHPDKMVLLAPDGAKYSYQVCDVPDGQISRERKQP